MSESRNAKILLALLACLILFVPACGRPSNNASENGKSSAKQESAQPTGNGVQVIMLGRSVMGGWFAHWSDDTAAPYERDGFSLYYRDIESPDAIMESVRRRADEDNGQAQIVFFKLCFDDFTGGSRDEAEENLDRNKGYVREAYDIVVGEKGKKLVVGNALPKVREATTGDLVWNHRQYNAWLMEFASAHPEEVLIFDEYGLLSDSAGNLKNAYASADDDSHPNDAGYAAMDGPLFDLLKSI